MDQILEEAVAVALGLRVAPRDDDSDRLRKEPAGTQADKDRKRRSRLH